MKLNRYIAALATTTALVGAGIAVPQAGAQNTETATATQAPVAGLTWEDVEVGAGETITVTPTGTPEGNLEFAGPRNARGFEFTTDEKTGAVTLKAPANVNPGASLTVPVDVYTVDVEAKTKALAGTYNFSVKVTEGGDAKTYSPAYPDLVVKQDGSATAELAGNVPEGTTFTLVATPERYKLAIDAAGNLSVTPDSKLGPGSNSSATVKVTYPDGTLEYITARITVSDENGNTTPYADRDYSKYEPAWGDAEVGGFEPATSAQKDEVPAGTTFAIAEASKATLEENAENFEITVDETSGEVQFTARKPLKEGGRIPVFVEVTYPDGSQETKQATFTIVESGKWQREQAAVSYPDITTPADKAGTSTPTLENVPEGTEFASESKLPEGWTLDVDKQTGAVTAQAPKNSPGGLSANLTVRATYPDGSTQAYPVKFTTTEPEQKLVDAITVTYPDLTVTAGESVTATPEASPELPEGTQFFVPNPTDELTIATDEATGKVTITPAADLAGGTATIPVTVRYPDGTAEKVKFTVQIKAKETTSATPTTSAKEPAPTTSEQSTTETTPEKTTEESSTPATTTSAEPTPTTTETTSEETTPEKTTEESTTPATSVTAEPTPTTTTTPQQRVFSYQWKSVEVRPGETKQIVPEGETVEGAKYAVQNVNGWDVTIDENTGVITVKVPQDAPRGEATVTITAVMPNGQKFKRTTTITVADGKDADRNKYEVTYPTSPNSDGELAPSKKGPEGTTYELVGKLPAGWSAEVDKNTGAVAVKAPGSTNPGTLLPISVKVTYPDGSSETALVTYTVPAGNNVDPKDRIAAKANVRYPETVTVKAGETKEIAPEGLLEGAKVSAPELSINGLDVSVNENTGMLKVSAAPDMKGKASSDLAITITFADGSTQKRTVKVRTESAGSTESTPTQPTKPTQPTETKTQQPTKDGSSTSSEGSSKGATAELSSEDGTPTSLGILVIVLGVFTAIAGLVAAAAPVLMPMLRDMGII